MKMNCWDLKDCGRQVGGEHEADMGVCPAALETKLDGVHGGVNAGRACWVVAGTMCDGEVQGTFAKKCSSCIDCDFYSKVMDEEGGGFLSPVVLLNFLGEYKGLYPRDHTA